MRVGPYEILDEIGRGGMGVVYRARRADLDRDFALKLLDASAAGPDGIARFRREAQAAARLAGHPHVVAVHDVGEGFVAADAANPMTDGRPAAPHPAHENAAHAARPVMYLAMDLIPGRSLEDLIADGEVDWRGALAMVAQAARGAQHAHEAGVLHRDLKPGNLLVTPDGHVRVADFGLAALHEADVATQRLTRSGTVLGTPAYMAPEQARGEACDARADVWSLGATLYEACGGGPPFGAGDAASVVTRLLREEPPPLRRLAPEVPRDLEAVIARCLAKDPAARYDTAAALADDLDRVGQGVAVAGGRRTRGARRLVLALAAAGGVAAVVGVATVAWRRAGAGADTLARATGARGAIEAAQASSAMCAELTHRSVDALRRLAAAFDGEPLDTRGRVDALSTVEAVADAVAAAHPGAVLPEAWRALGRGFAFQPGGFEALAAAATRATDDPLPHALEAHGRLVRYLHLVAFPDMKFGPAGVEIARFRESAEARAHREAAGEALRAAARQPAFAHLTEAAAWRAYVAASTRLADLDYAAAAEGLAPLADDPLLGPSALALRTFALLAARRYEEAVAASQRLLAVAPSARRLAVFARLAAGAVAEAEGRDPRPHLEAACALQDAAAAAGVEDPEARARAATARRMLAEGDADPRPRMREVLAEMDALLAAAPDDANVRLDRSLAHLAMGQAEEGAGGDGSAAFARAGADADAVLTAEPHRASAWAARGLARWARGAAMRARGHDSGAELLAAIADSDAALAREPGDATVLANRGAIRLELAQVANDARDLAAAETYWAGALADLDAAVAASPWAVAQRRKRAMGHAGVARYRVEHDQDPRPSLAAARADCDALLAAIPGDVAARLSRADAWVEEGNACVAAGVDPTPALEAAVADFSAVLVGHPTDLRALTNRASARATLGTWRGQAGGDFRADFAAAFADYDAAAAAHPHDVRPVYNRGNARQDLARAEQAVAADPRPTLRAAIADYDAVLAGAPEHAPATLNLGHAWRDLARAEVAADADPTAASATAEAVLTRATVQRPAEREAWLGLGNVLEERGDWLAAREADPLPAWADALAAYAEAARRFPDWVGPPQNSGMVRTRRGEFRQARGGDPAPDWIAACDDFVAAAARAPAWHVPHRNRGIVLVRLERLDEALAAYEAALRVAPEDAELLAHAAEIRAALGR